MKSDVCVFNHIELYGSKVSSIDLSKIRNVNMLDLSYSSISSLDVSKMKKLENLKIGYNTSMTSLDLTNSSVKYLACQNNLISQLVVSGSENLELLDFSSNTSLSASSIDVILSHIDRPTHKATIGQFYAVSRTTDSDSAYNSLISKGWTISIGQVL